MRRRTARSHRHRDRWWSPRSWRYRPDLPGEPRATDGVFRYTSIMISSRHGCGILLYFTLYHICQAWFIERFYYHHIFTHDSSTETELWLIGFNIVMWQILRGGVWYRHGMCRICSWWSGRRHRLRWQGPLELFSPRKQSCSSPAGTGKEKIENTLSCSCTKMHDKHPNLGVCCVYLLFPRWGPNP